MKRRATLAIILTAPAAIATIFMRSRKRAAGDRPHWTAVMGGATTNPTALSLGFATVVMGGMELDLRQTTMDATPAMLNIGVFWGGLLIRVPEEWHVSIEAHPTMGGARDYRDSPANDKPTPDLIVVGSVLMGGLAIAGDADLAEIAYKSPVAP